MYMYKRIHTYIYAYVLYQMSGLFKTYAYIISFLQSYLNYTKCWEKFRHDLAHLSYFKSKQSKIKQTQRLRNSYKVTKLQSESHNSSLFTCLFIEGIFTEALLSMRWWEVLILVNKVSFSWSFFCLQSLSIQ